MLVTLSGDLIDDGVKQQKATQSPGQSGSGQSCPLAVGWKSHRPSLLGDRVSLIEEKGGGISQP